MTTIHHPTRYANLPPNLPQISHENHHQLCPVSMEKKNTPTFTNVRPFIGSCDLFIWPPSIQQVTTTETGANDIFPRNPSTPPAFPAQSAHPFSRTPRTSPSVSPRHDSRSLKSRSLRRAIRRDDEGVGIAMWFIYIKEHSINNNNMANIIELTNMYYHTYL